MKNTVWIFCVLFVAVNGFSAENMPAVKVFFKECMSKAGTTKADMEETMKKNFQSDDPKIKATFFCASKMIGLVDDDGGFDTRVIVEKEKDADKIVSMANKCVNGVKVITEDNILVLLKCYNDLDKDHSFAKMLD